MISVSVVDLQSLASVRILRRNNIFLCEMLSSMFNRQAFTKRWAIQTGQDLNRWYDE